MKSAFCQFGYICQTSKEKDFLITYNINSSAITLLKKQLDGRMSKFIIKYFLIKFR